MANREKGESTVEIGGRTYTLVIGMEEICALEEMVSRGGRDFTIVEILGLVQRGSLRFVRALLWASLQRHHPKVTLADATTMVQQMGGLMQAMGKLGDLFASMQPDPKDVPAEDKGKRPQKARAHGTGGRSTPKLVASA